MEGTMDILTMMEKVGDLLEKVLVKISFVLFFAATLFAAEQVIARNVWESTFVWAEEVIVIMLLYSLFFLSAIATKNNSHIKLDMLIAHLTGKIKKVIDLLVYFLEMVTCAFLLVIYIMYLAKVYKSGSILMSGLPFPMWVAQASLGIAFAGIVYFSLLRICQLIYGGREGKE